MIKKMDKNENLGGSSLFQGNTSIAVGNDDQQREEEEDLEDRIRRQNELHDMLEINLGHMTFDDQSSIASTTLNSTCASQSEPECIDAPPFQSDNSYQQLQKMYKYRVKEEQRLKNELDELKNRENFHNNEMQRKYYLLEAEYNRIYFLYEQAQNALSEKNQTLDNQKKQLEEMSKEIEKLKQSESKLETEVKNWQTNSTILEQKLLLIEKGFGKSISEKQIRSHYEQEISNLQHSISVTNVQLQKKESECLLLKQQVTELEIINSNFITEKQDLLEKINKENNRCKSCDSIIHEIENIKVKFQNALGLKLNKNSTFLYNEDYFRDFRTHLLNYLEECQKRANLIDEMEIQISEFQKNEEDLKKELQVYKKSGKQINISSNAHYEQLINMLQTELKRNINEQTEARMEIDKFQTIIKDLRKQLSETNQNIALKDDNPLTETSDHQKHDCINSNNAQDDLNLEAKEKILSKQIKENQEIEYLRKLCQELKLQLIVAQETNDKLYSQQQKTKEILKRNSIEIAVKIKEIEKESKEIEHLKNHCQFLENELKIAQEANVELNSQNKIIDNKLKQYATEIQNDVKNIEKESQEMEYLQNHCYHLEQELIIAQETNAKLNSNLTNAHKTINDLNEKNILLNTYEDLVIDLKKKSSIFEEYMTNKQINMPNISEKKMKQKQQVQSGHKKYTETRNIEMLQQIMTKKSEQYEILLEENRCLKEKIAFDRSAMNELAQVLNDEILRLKELLEVAGKKNLNLLLQIKTLETNSILRQKACDKLVLQMKCASEIINKFEVMSAQYSHVYRSQYEKVLYFLQCHVHKCMSYSKIETI